MIRVALVDDHPVFLEGLYTILSLKDPEIEVVATATNGQEALAVAEEHRPDVMLMDIKMPIMDGVEATKSLRKNYPEITIIMLTTFDDRPLIRSALSAGASGYLLKDAEARQIVEAIKHVTRSNIVISGDLALKLSGVDEADATPDRAQESPQGSPSVRTTGRVKGGALISQATEARADEHDAELLKELSERQLEILKLVAVGRSNNEISAELHLSEKTVRNYMSQIYEILNIHSRTKVALWAIQTLRNAFPRKDE